MMLPEAALHGVPEPTPHIPGVCGGSRGEAREPRGVLEHRALQEQIVVESPAVAAGAPLTLEMPAASPSPAAAALDPE